ncbi:HesA/MoeB/ThiF family protein [Desulfoscipio gibsoniae]|uniref:Dinucleotide-utilizing enzyme possibly involved in molybdopterin or thiamin biosynthesis n=1 Tax=Desulfoscipio gibsoniae DSM 7213 TaxID=767817 RepID=R4KGN2_9FIRM|nr:HesA/MoeB/ThiF family protein [Desulfoscipio gibsoniae]AGL00822.1 dinucleotide-utilizing enzyme possibly involved in molybdopterin or thiamin biosynthesis [Desulfoscipio gibsoniae DSM 7213]
MSELTGEQLARYKRNILLDGVGTAGQFKLLQSRVLVVGAGGLGSPAGYYLAAAGIGHIGLVDGDRVDLSNLQRQIIHTTADLGRSKIDSAREKITALNPDVQVNGYGEWLDEQNFRELISRYDLVVDGTDNFAARLLINRACVEEQKPYIFGGVLGYSGQAMTILPGQGPCLACIFRDVPPDDAPSSDKLGVLGAVPGIIGAVEAAEAVKVLLGIGEPLLGRLFTFDALSMQFYTVEISRDPACPVCGT